MLLKASTTHSLPSSLCPNFNQLPISSKLSCYNQNFVFSRSSRKQCMEVNYGRFGQFLCRVFANSEESEFRTSKCKSCNAMELLHAVDDFIVSEKSTSANMLRRKDAKPSNYQNSNLPFQSHLKFMLLCGFFTLQGTQHALAGSDIATQLQSISSLGNLGNISTAEDAFPNSEHALLASRKSAAVVFLRTFGVLGVMTIISVILGRTFHYVDDVLPFRFGNVDFPVDDIAAVCLLVYFGVSTLLEASSSDGLKAEEEQKEVKLFEENNDLVEDLNNLSPKAELVVSDFSGNGAGILAAANTVISTFLLVFVAEWGDKSFFPTIALAAASSPLGVVGEALAGHGVATMLAVLGGSLLGTFLSEKVIGYIGGTLFLIFAVATLIETVS